MMKFKLNTIKDPFSEEAVNSASLAQQPNTGVKLGFAATFLRGWAIIKPSKYPCPFDVII
jgi:hypothetical protein